MIVLLAILGNIAFSCLFNGVPLRFMAIMGWFAAFCFYAHTWAKSLKETPQP